MLLQSTLNVFVYIVHLLYVTYSVDLLQPMCADFVATLYLSVCVAIGMYMYMSVCVAIGIDVQLVGLIKTLIDPENIMTETPTVSDSGHFE